MPAYLNIRNFVAMLIMLWDRFKHNLLPPMQRVKRLLTEIYHVPLTIEQLGIRFDTLQLQISCVGLEIH